MSAHFDPRRVLKRISNSLLRQFFDRHGGLPGVDWAALKETQIEPIFAGWQAMPGAKCRHVGTILQDVQDLSDDRGISALIEQLKHLLPDRIPEFEACQGHADRAMWAHLNADAVFATAAHFASSDALAAGRHWIKRNGLPKRAIENTSAAGKTLEAALSEFYWKEQLRGRYCSVEHYQRPGGAEYFFAYLDNYADHEMVFEEGGVIVRREERRAFENVFVLHPEEGTMEMHARGGKAVCGPLQEIFCRAVLDIEVEPADPLRPSFKLDHLLGPDRALITDPRDHIEGIRINMVCLSPVDRPAECIELRVYRDGVHGIDEAIQEYLNTTRLPLNRLRVRQMRFQLKFGEGGPGRSLTFTVTRDTCTLKDCRDNLRVIGERCLRLWKVAS